MKHIIKLFVILTLPLVLTSCVGEEPNDIGFITALGIDKAEKGYNYTVQFANPTKISGGASEEGGSGGDIVENITVEAPTLYSAINNANSIISKDLSLAHAKLIVVSEEVAEKGLGGIADIIARNNEIRPDVYLAVAEDAGEYLEGVKPVVELNPVKYYQLTYENKQGGPIPQNNASMFYMANTSKDRDCALPLAGIAGIKEEGGKTDAGSGQSGGDEQPSENKKNESAKRNESDFQKGTKDYLPGEAGVKVKNKSETMGLAVFNGYNYIGKLGSSDAYIYNILMGDINNSRATFYDSKSPDIPITMSLQEKRKPVFEIDRNRKHVKVKLMLEAELLSVPKKHKNELSDSMASNMISDSADDFLKRVYGEMGSDLLGIRGRLKGEFAANKSFNEYIKGFSPKDWTFEVDTELIIKRTGMTYYY